MNVYNLGNISQQKVVGIVLVETVESSKFRNWKDDENVRCIFVFRVVSVKPVKSIHNFTE